MEYGANMTEYIQRELIRRAWAVSNHAIARKRKVGAALVTYDGEILVGCNVEQDFCNSVHAEANAIVQMVTFGYKQFEHILIVSTHPGTTPCGYCMDWIMQFGGPDALIAITHDKSETQQLIWRRAEIFMPLYPI